MLAAVLSFPDASHECSAVFNMVHGLKGEDVQLWMRQTIVKIVESAARYGLGGVDGQSLVYVITKFLGVAQLADL